MGARRRGASREATMSEQGTATYFCAVCAMDVYDDVCPLCGNPPTWVTLQGGDDDNLGLTRMPLSLYERIRATPDIAEKVRYTGDDR